jgi:hypothetical protein
VARLIVPRSSVSATRLADGRVLVLGSGSEDAVGEIYDPAKNVWTLVAPHRIRAEHATLLGDGRVLVGSNPPAIYDPASDTWIDLEVPRADLLQATLDLLPDGRVLAVGPRQVSMIDAASGTFRLVAKRWARFRHSTVLLADGRIAILGGVAAIELGADLEDGHVAQPEADSVPQTVIFDPKDESFAAAEPGLDQLHDFGAVAWPDGRILVVGGDQDLSVFGTPHGAQIIRLGKPAP